MNHKESMSEKGGLPVDSLKDCLGSVGWTCCEDPSFQRLCAGRKDAALDDPTLEKFWKEFRGEGVLTYGFPDISDSIGHAVVIRSGGIVFDPGSGPEEGEFFSNHLKRQQTNIRFDLFFRVEKISPALEKSVR
jgi:hypothetical protein